MRKKVRLMRRGKTTVSNASIRMIKIRTMPAIDAHQCIRDEISDDAGMVADSGNEQGYAADCLSPQQLGARCGFTALPPRNVAPRATNAKRLSRARREARLEGNRARPKSGRVQRRCDRDRVRRW